MQLRQESMQQKLVKKQQLQLVREHQKLQAGRQQLQEG